MELSVVRTSEVIAGRESSPRASRKFHVTLVRARLISREGSFNNEAVPHPDPKFYPVRMVGSMNSLPCRSPIERIPLNNPRRARMT
jgi:hypothetical protein